MSDLIERQAAIDAIKNTYGLSYIEDGFNRQDAVRILEDLPSAQPEPQWIPCSGTIDIPHHEVLCCDRYGEELIGWLSYVDDQWLCESDGEMMYDPVAWREKPEPYKEAKHG